MKRILIATVVCVVLALAGFALAARSGALNPSEAELRAKYRLATSKMIEIDGEPIHYADEVPRSSVHHGHTSLAATWPATATPTPPER